MLFALSVSFFVVVGALVAGVSSAAVARAFMFFAAV